jgi:hypothetical protein
MEQRRNNNQGVEEHRPPILTPKPLSGLAGATHASHQGTEGWVIDVHPVQRPELRWGFKRIDVDPIEQQSFVSPQRGKGDEMVARCSRTSAHLLVTRFRVVAFSAKERHQ